MKRSTKLLGTGILLGVMGVVVNNGGMIMDLSIVSYPCFLILAGVGGIVFGEGWRVRKIDKLFLRLEVGNEAN